VRRLLRGGSLLPRGLRDKELCQGCQGVRSKQQGGRDGVRRKKRSVESSKEIGENNQKKRSVKCPSRAVKDAIFRKGQGGREKNYNFRNSEGAWDPL